MGGIAPLVTTALPLANSVIGTVRSANAGQSSAAAQQAAAQQAAQQAAAQQAAAELEYKRQQDAAQAAAAQAALERKYREEAAAAERSAQAAAVARQQQAQLEAEAQARQWSHDAELRQREQELQRQRDEAAAAVRAKEMDDFRSAQEQTLAQLRASQEQTVHSKETDAQTQLAQLTAAADAAEQRRLTALRQAVSKTRAGLGARGVTAQDGSGEAILLGLTNSSETERKDAQATEQLKRAAIQQSLDEAKRRNLLELSQLADRQRLEYMSKFF
ncbi:hypothetical protein [Azospirillum largimobile]